MKLIRPAGFLALIALGSIVVTAEPTPLLIAGATIRISGAKGAFDFIEIDLPRQRLLAAHTKEGTLDVIDIAASKGIARIPIGAPTGLAAAGQPGQ